MDVYRGHKTTKQQQKTALYTHAYVNSIYHEMGYFCKSLISKCSCSLTLLHSERPKLYGVLAALSAIGLSSTEIKITEYSNHSLTFMEKVSHFSPR